MEAPGLGMQIREKARWVWVVEKTESSSSTLCAKSGVEKTPFHRVACQVKPLLLPVTGHERSHIRFGLEPDSSTTLERLFNINNRTLRQQTQISLLINPIVKGCN